jgi:hypothetical protein
MLWKNKNSGADFAYFTSMPKLVIHEVELYNLSKNLIDLENISNM